MLDCRHERLDRVCTLPLSVVAANNRASVLAPADDKRECVTVQASGCIACNVSEHTMNGSE
jgi:hypothetical protein